MIRQDIIKEARSYLGVPFRHQGRNRKAGVDCAGLIICVAAKLVPEFDFDFTKYRRYPESDQMMRLCLERGTKVEFSDAKHGDVVLLFDVDQSWPCHVGFLALDKGAPRIIHSLCMKQKVVEHTITDDWKRKINCAFRLNGVD